MNKANMKKLLLVIWSVAFNLFTFIIVLSWGKGADPKKALFGKAVFGTFAMAIGAFFLRFPSHTVRFFYERNGLVFRDEISRQAAFDSMRYYGLNATIWGFLIILASVIAYFH